MRSIETGKSKEQTVGRFPGKIKVIGAPSHRTRDPLLL
jgi:hypothetical protein